MDVGDDGRVRTGGVRGLGCAHGGECERGRGHSCSDVQLRWCAARRSALSAFRLVPTVADAAPVVSTASANVAPSGAGTVTFCGLSFGTDGRTPTASLNAAEPCGSTAWTSATTVACTPQTYGGTASLRTAVSLSAVVGTVLGQFSFDGACACAAAVGEIENARRRISSHHSSHRRLCGCGSAVREHEQPAERRRHRRRDHHDRRPGLRRVGRHAECVPRCG